MRRKTLAKIAIASSALLLLAGCAGAQAPSVDDELANKDTVASIDYAIWNAVQEPSLQKVIAKFNKEYPKIKVTVQVTPFADYFTKLQTQGASKTLPDTYAINNINAQLYMAAGLMAPVDPIVTAKKIDLANYPENLLKSYSLDGTLYAVPQNSNTIAMWYNKAIFAQAGVDLPTGDWTWEQFHSAAKTISDKLGDQGITGVATDLTGQQAYYNTIFQAGGHVLSNDKKRSGYDDPKTIEGLQFWADLIADGSSPSVAELSETPANARFVNGQSAMMFSGSWETASILASPVKDDVTVVPLPRGENHGVVLAGTGLAVSPFSKNVAAARAWQTFMSSMGGQFIMASDGQANPSLKDAQQAFIDSSPAFDLQVFADAQGYASEWPVSANTPAWNQLERDLLPEAFSGARPVADVAKELAEGMNKILAAE